MGVLEIVLSDGPSLTDSLVLINVDLPCWFSTLASIPVSRLSARMLTDMRDLMCWKAGRRTRIAPERMIKIPAM